MGLSVLRDRLEDSCIRYVMESKVIELSNIMDYCLKCPGTFIEAFQKIIPAYKRTAIIDLMEKAKEEG